MTTPPQPRVLWQGEVASGIFRMVDRGLGLTERFVIERQAGLDGLGIPSWTQVPFQYADALQAAFLALAPPQF